MPLSSSSCCSGAGVEVVADWFWFQEVGYETDFSVTLLNQLKVGAFFGVAFFIIFYLNLYLATRFSSQGYWVDRDDLIHIPPWESGTQPIGTLVLLASLLFSLFAALRGSAQWENYLRFLYGTPFGTADPLFNRDIGFYVFQLPFLKDLYGWLMTVLIITILGTGVVYFIRPLLPVHSPANPPDRPRPRKHLIVLGACLFFVGTWGAWIALYEMLYSKRGVVFGPGYTDVNTQLLMLKILIVVTALCGLTILYMLFRREWKVPAVGVGAFLAVLIIGTGIYPSLVQRFKVTPDEIVLEKPYLEKNIQYTRMAYGLNSIKDREFPAEDTLTLEDLRRNELTIKNIRLWDHVPLLATYSQLQEIRTYYKFIDVDNDRYTINGELRQVDALRPGTLLPRPPLPHLGQRTSDLHPRVWRRPWPGQPDFAGRTSRILHQGHPPRFFG